MIESTNERTSKDAAERATALESLVPMVAVGADARTFLQGQLSADLRKLSPTHAVLGAACNAQGRAQAIVTVLEHEGSVVCLLPADSVEKILARFRRFTLSSRVDFQLPGWVVATLPVGAARELVGDVPASPGDCQWRGDLAVVRWWSPEPRFLLVSASTDGVTPAAAESVKAWKRADILAGLPSVHPETEGRHVLQTLNLDVIGGVSYDKGCYVGQEVVARARRGGVSRRMFGFSAACSPPRPGAPLFDAEREVGEVVDAAESPTGCVLLAVVELAHGASLFVGDRAGPPLSPLDLPYEVPTARR